MAEPTPAQREAMTTSYHAFLHNTSLTMLFLAPALIALPPRKLDLYTLALTGSFVASANHLTKERTGRGLLGNLSSFSSHHQHQHQQPIEAQGQKTKAEDFAEKYRAEKERRRLLDEPTSMSSPAGTRPPSALEAAAKELWMGGETEGWKERRLHEEQEKIAQGEGYGSMILGQIWEVWNWGEKKAEDIKEKDKEVLYRKQQEERARRREEEFPTMGGEGGDVKD
jgi:hypothetical protein